MLPEGDRNLIVAVHYYAPLAFTHQGARWVEPPISTTTGVTWGMQADRARIDADFAAAQDWATRYGRPLLLGAFGAYESADMGSRAFDPQTGSWIEPIAGALLPEPQPGR